ncbi:hypothetical protein IQ272_08710 [Chroococcidiopsidales cyanobacterium LEGE 13417]|uniref:hypothetical protein n=1 Tax=Chroococcidiopsis sp. CCALA 051 TaxID=869949 RepID=UPI001304FCF2|nr:hypothetical protein [Chroococcidiopsis sp. CCALA 051]MBE9016218.1 hypothetical protein [Chroococcidiopsidales cyanobacterium LEGE 13417]
MNRNTTYYFGCSFMQYLHWHTSASKSARSPANTQLATNCHSQTNSIAQTES